MAATKESQKEETPEPDVQVETVQENEPDLPLEVHDLVEEGHADLRERLKHGATHMHSFHPGGNRGPFVPAPRQTTGETTPRDETDSERNERWEKEEVAGEP